MAILGRRQSFKPLILNSRAGAIGDQPSRSHFISVQISRSIFSTARPRFRTQITNQIKPPGQSVNKYRAFLIPRLMATIRPRVETLVINAFPLGRPSIPPPAGTLLLLASPGRFTAARPRFATRVFTQTAPPRMSGFLFKGQVSRTAALRPRFQTQIIQQPPQHPIVARMHNISIRARASSIRPRFQTIIIEPPVIPVPIAINVVLTITDNGDGTGGMATITGSPLGSTNTIYRANWTGQFGNNVWTVAATRTGDGSVPVGGQGYFVWMDIAVSEGSANVSNEVFQSLTNGRSPKPMGPDEETSQAVLNAWNTSPVASLVPGGLLKDRLVKPTATPYARIESKQEARGKVFSSGGRYIDYREVTITIWGIGDVATSQIVPAVQALLDDQPLVFQTGKVAHMRNEPKSIEVNEEADIKSGQEYRAAVFKYCVWTDRQL